MTSPKTPSDPCAANTDRELWRAPPGDYYADSIHVTAAGGIGIDVGGRVFVRPLRMWHDMASKYDALLERAERAEANENELRMTRAAYDVVLEDRNRVEIDKAALLKRAEAAEAEVARQKEQWKLLGEINDGLLAEVARLKQGGVCRVCRGTGKHWNAFCLACDETGGLS